MLTKRGCGKWFVFSHMLIYLFAASMGGRSVNGQGKEVSSAISQSSGMRPRGIEFNNHCDTLDLSQKSEKRFNNHCDKVKLERHFRVVG